MSTTLPPIKRAMVNSPAASPMPTGRLRHPGPQRDEPARPPHEFQRLKRMETPFHTLKLDADVAAQQAQNRGSGAVSPTLLTHKIQLERTGGCRGNISESIEARVVETAAVEGKAFGAGLYDNQGRRRGGKANWQDAYVHQCDRDASHRKEIRDTALVALKNYKPVSVDTSWLLRKVNPEGVNPERWKDVWNRNLLCNVCNNAATPGVGRLECYTCPVVQHVCCTFEYEEDVPERWYCADCQVQIQLTMAENEQRVRDKELRAAQLQSVMHLQRSIRMFIQYRYYKRLNRVLKCMQGHTRGFLSRVRFHKTYAKAPYYWPFKIRVVSAVVPTEQAAGCHDGKPAEAMGVVTVLKNEKNDDTKHQLYRLETSMEKLSAAGHETVGSKWNDILLVPVSVASVTVCFTVASCPKNPNEQDAGTSEFLGQASMDLTSVLLHRRQIRTTLPLGPVQYDIKERNGTRIQNQWRQASGSVTVEIMPTSHCNSQCGYLDEVTVTSNRVTPKRKWFVVLLDGNIMLQHRPFDTKPKQTFSLLKAVVKHNTTVVGCTGVIEIKTNVGSGFHGFSCPDDSERLLWFTKMRNWTEKGRQKYLEVPVRTAHANVPSPAADGGEAQGEAAAAELGERAKEEES